MSVEDLSDVILNKLRLPTIGKSDVVFLAKKYIHSLPNQVQYEKMIDDFNTLSRGQIFNVSSTKIVCTLIRKACLINHNTTEVETYFSKYCKTMNGLLTFEEFLGACTTGLGLLPPLCERKSLESLFNEMDTARTKKLTMDQIRIYIARTSP